VTNTALSSQVRRESLEARVGLRLAATLNESTAALSHDIEARLRFSRERALARARQLRASAAPSAVTLQRGGAAALGGTPWWLKLASAAPIVLLAAGLLLIVQINDMQQIQAAAEIDAVLLADDLPPAAYADPGFGEFLKEPPQP
jgi:hypothetical protein